MEDYEESLWIPRSNDWSEAGLDFNLMGVTGADMTNEISGLGGAHIVPSYTVNNVTSSGDTLWDNTDGSVPGYRPLIEHNESLHPSVNIAHVEEVQEVERDYFMSFRPNAKQWEKRKPEIRKLYESFTLRTVVTEMAKKGFHATEPMYKRKFNSWGWRKYQSIKKYGRPDGKSSTPKSQASDPIRRGNYASTDAENLVPSSLSGTVAVGSPTPTHFGVPKPMQQNDLDRYVNSMLFHVRSLYISSMDQKKWKFTNPYEVQEDTHGDLLLGVAIALRNFESLSPDIGGKSIRKAFKTLEKVVADCGLFSLPTIWESFLCMKRGGHPQLAEKFLSHALQLYMQKTCRENIHNPFVQVLVGLRKISKYHPHMLEQVIVCAYRSCVDHVIKKLSSFHLTTLSLWANFVVQVDNSSASEIRDATNRFRLTTQISEADHMSDDYALRILGLTVYVLQSQEPMAEEAERVALEMLSIVNRRLEEAGEKLGARLLSLWKKLNYFLGTFYYARGDLHKATVYFQDCLSHGIVDDIDTLALERLEWLCSKLDMSDEVERLWQWRINGSRVLLQEDDLELAQCERVDKDEDERNGDNGTDEGIYEDNGSGGQYLEDKNTTEMENAVVEDAVVEDAEMQDAEVEDDEIEDTEMQDAEVEDAEVEDAEVEIQILQGEMKKLQQRMIILQKKVEKHKGEETRCMEY